MTASRLRFGMYVGARRVAHVGTAVQAGRPIKVVRFADGTTERYAPDQTVDQVRSRITIAAGPVAAGWYCSAAPKVRASSGQWRGERGGTRMERVIERASRGNW